MRLTKYTHSCVRIDDGEAGLVVDPGTFSPDGELASALDGVHAVLVTHEHPDHLDVDALVAAAGGDDLLRVWAPAAVCDRLEEREALRGRTTAVASGESFEAGGLAVAAFGGQHALIHTSIPMVANLGYLVAGAVYHPGDSFVVPEVPVERLLLPLHAPWSKVGEVLDHVIAVRPRHVHQVHDGLLNERGRDLVAGHVDRVATRYGGTYAPLEAGESVEV